MEGVKDSNFVNFANTIDAIHRKLAKPKQRGVRDPGGDADLQANLAQDMVSIITSPLSQLGKVVPVPGMSAAQVEALRALYALVKKKTYSNDGLEARVEAVARLLNPSFTPRANEEVAGDQSSIVDVSSGPVMPVRRSTRLAELPKTSYQEDANDLEDLLNEGDDESNGEEGLDEQVEEDVDEQMDGVEPTIE
ncbi:hypothetical protein MMC27_005099 [Xylographa pallens]|nr:hypothetical protein [Xylographa pallens]